jgi:hypothetical protein
MIKAKWMRYDERTNALDNLEKCYEFIKTVEKEKQNWKWVIITLHGAIYGFAVSACRGTNSYSVIKKSKTGFGKLIDFNEALKMCQNPQIMTANIDYTYYELSKDQKESTNRLHKVFRNNFEHFTPKSWSIELHDMPLMILDCLEVVRLLIVYSDVGWRLKKVKLRKAKSYIYRSKKIIKDSNLFKETLALK